MHGFHPYHQGTHLWAHCTCIAMSDDRGWLTWTVWDYLSLYLFSVSPMVDAHWWAWTWLTKISLCAHSPMSIHMTSCSQSFNITHSRPLTNQPRHSSMAMSLRMFLPRANFISKKVDNWLQHPNLCPWKVFPVLFLLRKALNGAEV